MSAIQTDVTQARLIITLKSCHFDRREKSAVRVQRMQSRFLPTVEMKLVVWSATRFESHQQALFHGKRRTKYVFPAHGAGKNENRCGFPRHFCPATAPILVFHYSHTSRIVCRPSACPSKKPNLVHKRAFRCDPPSLVAFCCTRGSALHRIERGDPDSLRTSRRRPFHYHRGVAIDHRRNIFMSARVEKSVERNLRISKT